MTDDPTELVALIERRVAAVRDRDVEALIAAHDPEVQMFPVLPPTRTTGRDAVRDGLRAWLDGYESGPEYDVTDLDVVRDGDLGVCSFFYHVRGTLKGGGDVDMWVRSTQVCRRRGDGAWLVIRSHESVPFDAESGQALIDAAPDPSA
ncbi:SnoaL-like domain-containing protein [Nocardioides anomalus]|uniref:SnoaL-like domain-containing protein n=1 Tax=Nocardioides anomalus TaxID=2712223 RepID=A0A6G6WG74_9ACTN|nr:nuclear transport factor 2 family protein [Nocardioides anomalus]QIG44050.1 SnoaL-like domain-containing protein [Nocardioides anomalus]